MSCGEGGGGDFGDHLDPVARDNVDGREYALGPSGDGERADFVIELRWGP